MWGGMGAGVVGAWPACLFLTRRSLVTSALSPVLVYVSCTWAKSLHVHTVFILQEKRKDYFTYVSEAGTEDLLLGSVY